ncbi:MAG: DNA-binding protein, partial [Bacteroidia bacterium]|nr:DNA-binding protein [Bacteroidia bacterium]
SMLPIPEKSWITAEFVQDWTTMKDDEACIILTLEDGIVFKVIKNRIVAEGKLMLHSLNPVYKPYDIAVNDIREIWKFVNFISPELPEPVLSGDHLLKTIESLRYDVDLLKKRGNRH